MSYLSYRHRSDASHELVLPDGAAFPSHLTREEWYLHSIHQGVSGRTEADIATMGYCHRSGSAVFGRRVAGARGLRHRQI